MHHPLALLNIERQAQAINNLRTVIDSEKFNDLVWLVTELSKKRNGRVLMAGVGKNANIASKIAETMASLGIPSMPLNVSHLGHGDYGYVMENDIVIHISRSGSTREMLEAISHIKLIRPGVQQVLVHCKPTKADNPEVNLEICIGGVAEGDAHGLAPTTSTTALLCFLDCLTVQVSNNIGFERLDFLKFHPDGALGEMLKAEVKANTFFDEDEAC